VTASRPLSGSGEIEEAQVILAVSENGYGKRASSFEERAARRAYPPT
jgi:hypothetical protein